MKKSKSINLPPPRANRSEETVINIYSYNMSPSPIRSNDSTLSKASCTEESVSLKNPVEVPSPNLELCEVERGVGSQIESPKECERESEATSGQRVDIELTHTTAENSEGETRDDGQTSHHPVTASEEIYENHSVDTQMVDPPSAATTSSLQKPVTRFLRLSSLPKGEPGEREGLISERDGNEGEDSQTPVDTMDSSSSSTPHASASPSHSIQGKKGQAIEKKGQARQKSPRATTTQKATKTENRTKDVEEPPVTQTKENARRRNSIDRILSRSPSYPKGADDALITHEEEN